MFHLFPPPSNLISSFHAFGQGRKCQSGKIKVYPSERRDSQLFGSIEEDIGGEKGNLFS
jgi:hypothetical protein